MWCTRWFLPLLLLPLPTATPFFLILFLVSLTLHARPCFYCIILLTALFTSSCYWQPVPTDVILGSVFPNGTVDHARVYVLNASSQQVAPDLVKTPKLTEMNDRCWCDLSGTSLFEPFNTTRWQWNSFSRNVIASNPQVDRTEDTSEPKSTVPVSQDTTTTHSNKKWITSIVPSSMEPFSGSDFLNKWLIRPFTLFRSQNLTAANVSSDDADQTSERSTKFELEISTAYPDHRPRKSSRIYDLRPYNIDLVVDLQWPRTYS